MAVSSIVPSMPRFRTPARSARMPPRVANSTAVPARMAILMIDSIKAGSIGKAPFSHGRRSPHRRHAVIEKYVARNDKQQNRTLQDQRERGGQIECQLKLF